MSTNAVSGLTPAARRVLDAAAELFYGEGIHAVGVDSITARAGVTKKTLYDRFGSKDALVALYLRERDQRWRNFLLGYLAERGGGPRDELLGAFDALAAWSAEHNPRGCGFVNAHAEIADTAHPGYAAVAEQKRWMSEFFARRATDAGFADPDAVADKLMLLYDGALVTKGMGTVADAIPRARAIAALVLAHARGGD